MQAHQAWKDDFSFLGGRAIHYTYYTYMQRKKVCELQVPDLHPSSRSWGLQMALQPCPDKTAASPLKWTLKVPCIHLQPTWFQFLYGKRRQQKPLL